LLNPTPQDYRDAMVLVSRFPDQSISLFDATLAWSCRGVSEKGLAEMGKKCLILQAQYARNWLTAKVHIPGRTFH